MDADAADERARLAAEAQTAAETRATDAETAQTMAETRATEAETAQTMAETRATEAETAQTMAETRATEAETAQTMAETRATEAETAKTMAETRATTAEGQLDGCKQRLGGSAHPPSLNSARLRTAHFPMDQQIAHEHGDALASALARDTATTEPTPSYNLAANTALTIAQGCSITPRMSTRLMNAEAYKKAADAATDVAADAAIDGCKWQAELHRSRRAADAQRCSVLPRDGAVMTAGAAVTEAERVART